MNYYIEVRVHNDDYKIMGMVYSRLHFTLFNMQEHGIGVNFPFSNSTSTGTVIQLQAEKEDVLLRLQETGFTQLIERYCDVSGIKEVPEKAAYVTVKKWRNKHSGSRIRRSIKRGGDPEIFNKLVKYPNKPKLCVYSASQKKWTTRYFAINHEGHKYKSGEFDYFGLSNGGMVATF